MSESKNDVRKLVHEDTEWCDVWLPHVNRHDLPRVLLIGDSITRAYYSEVEKKLEGLSFVGRLATSRSVGDPGLIREIEAVLTRTLFDVVHFNNGMHGWGYSEMEYEKFFPELLEVITTNAPVARLIWAHTTPVRVARNLEQFAPRTSRVQERNAIAARTVTPRDIPINDLFDLAQCEHFAADGVHFNALGITAQAEQVARFIQDALASQ